MILTRLQLGNLYGGLRVKPFEGDPCDEELLKVAEAVEASGN